MQIFFMIYDGYKKTAFHILKVWVGFFLVIALYKLRGTMFSYTSFVHKPELEIKISLFQKYIDS